MGVVAIALGASPEPLGSARIRLRGGRKLFAPLPKEIALIDQDFRGTVIRFEVPAIALGAPAQPIAVPATALGGPANEL